MLTRSFKRFWHDRSGAVALIFGLTFVPFIIGGGIAIDFGRAATVRSVMQGAADAAVISARAAFGRSDSERIALGEKFFNENLSGEAVGATPTVRVADDLVTVTSSFNLPTTFMAIIGHRQMTVGVQAAASPYGAPICVLLLEPSEPALYVNSDSSLNTDCKIKVNSAHEKAIEINSNASVVSDALYVKGSAYINSGSSVEPTPNEGVPPMDDPLADLPAPPEASGSCDHNDYTIDSGESATMSPGVYCGKTLVQNNATAYLNSGVYVFKDGEFEVNAYGKVIGNNVLLVFMGDSAFLKVNSDSSIQISGRSNYSDPYRGLLIYQERTADSPSHIINSDSTSKLEGVIYVPNGTIEVNSLSTVNEPAAYTSVIARKMILNSQGTFQVRSDYESGTPYSPELGELAVGARLVPFPGT